MNHIFDAAILDCNWMLDRERAGAEAVWRVGGGEHRGQTSEHAREIAGT